MPNQYSMTIRETVREMGRYPLRNGKFIWSPEGFRKAYKVGDLITGGWSITGRITAIGETRFLYKVTYGSNVRERVGMISSATGWGKP